MENRIIFLGTGGGRIVVANQLRATGGFVIQTVEHQIHVDPGPGALVNAKSFNVNPTDTDIVFVSHAHIDHANDINALIDAMTLGGLHRRGTVISTSSVIEGEDRLGPWLLPNYKALVDKILVVKNGDIATVDNLKFHITETSHDEPHNVGLILETPDLVIGYTSDTIYTPKIAKQYRGCHVLIANVLRPGNDMWKTHMCSEDAEKLASRARPELFIIQHFGAKMLRARPMYEARDIQHKTGIRTMAATDGMVVELGNFKAN